MEKIEKIAPLKETGLSRTRGFAAQGAGMAIEDAAMRSRCLQETGRVLRRGSSNLSGKTGVSQKSGVARQRKSHREIDLRIA
jgi:hypothetical protein